MPNLHALAVQVRMTQSDAAFIPKAFSKASSLHIGLYSAIFAREESASQRLMEHPRAPNPTPGKSRMPQSGGGVLIAALPSLYVARGPGSICRRCLAVLDFEITTPLWVFVELSAYVSRVVAGLYKLVDLREEGKARSRKKEAGIETRELMIGSTLDIWWVTDRNNTLGYSYSRGADQVGRYVVYVVRSRLHTSLYLPRRISVKVP